jgi:hypothetical protein
MLARRRPTSQLLSVAAQARRDVPEVKPYYHAMTEDKLLIVNPSDHKIADVVGKRQQ